MPDDLPDLSDLLRLPLRGIVALAARTGLRVATLAAPESLATLEQALLVASGRPFTLQLEPGRGTGPASPHTLEADESLASAGRSADRAIAKFSRRDDPAKRHAETAEHCQQSLVAAFGVAESASDRELFVRAIRDDYRRLCQLCGGRAGADFPPIDVSDFDRWPLWPEDQVPECLTRLG